MTTIGFATIGQTPRSDLVPYLVDHLSKGVRVLEAGVLDGLTPAEMANLDHDDSKVHMVTRLRDGGSARIAYVEAVPRMQVVVDGLVGRGADLIVILCGADWSVIEASVPIVNPGRLFPGLIQGLVGRSRLGVVKPSAGQVERTLEQYRHELGLDVVVTSAFPYDADACQAARAAGLLLKEEGAELVWMTCVGMGEEMREALQAELDRPVILARSILARVIDELVA